MRSPPSLSCRVGSLDCKKFCRNSFDTDKSGSPFFSIRCLFLGMTPWYGKPLRRPGGRTRLVPPFEFTGFLSAQEWPTQATRFIRPLSGSGCGWSNTRPAQIPRQIPKPSRRLWGTHCRSFSSLMEVVCRDTTNRLIIGPFFRYSFGYPYHRKQIASGLGTTTASPSADSSSFWPPPSKRAP